MNSKQLKVMNFLEGSPQDHLVFKGETNPAEMSKLSLDNLTYKCISLTHTLHSLNPATGIIETRAGKWRSSLDIWRHVKFYKPEVTLLDVMSTIFNIQDKLIGHYCRDIHRRTFKKEPCFPGWNNRDKDTEDEYDLEFYDWENINRE